MAQPPRRHTSALDKAEAMFKAATSKPAEAPAKPIRLSPPVGKEIVSMRIDRDVLEHFQQEGPGWQDRINSALRKACGLDDA